MLALLGYNILIVAMLSWIMTLIGAMMVRNIFLFESNRAFVWGAGYFMGMGVLLTTTRLLTHMGHDFYGAFLMTLVTLGIWTTLKRPCFPSWPTWQIRPVVKAGLWIVFWYLVFMGIWLVPEASILDPFAVHGSLHSGRYAHLAEFIVTTNDIPVLNQNTGQSILAAITLLLGGHGAGWALHGWLFVSGLFLGCFFYGLLLVLGLPRNVALPGTAILMLGNVSLSLTHVLVYDSGNPWLFNGYTDSMASMATCLIFILASFHPASLLLKPAMTWRKIEGMLLVPFCLGVFWHQVGAHIFVIFFAIFGIGLLLSFWKPFPCSLTRGWVVIPLLAGAVVGVWHGGMLTPASLRTPVAIEGMMETRSADSQGMVVYPHYPHAYHDGIRFQHSAPKYRLYGYDLDRLLGGVTNFQTAQLPVLSLEEELWSAIRILFFPLLGLLLFGWRVWNARRFSSPDAEAWPFRLTLLVVTCLALLMGGGMAFAIQLFGYKWELSRFAILGITLSMILLVWALYEQTADWSAVRRKYFWMVFCGVITMGPVMNSLSASARHLTPPYRNVVERAGEYDLTTSTSMERYRMLLDHVYLEHTRHSRMPPPP